MIWIPINNAKKYQNKYHVNWMSFDTKSCNTLSINNLYDFHETVKQLNQWKTYSSHFGNHNMDCQSDYSKRELIFSKCTSSIHGRKIQWCIRGNHNWLSINPARHLFDDHKNKHLITPADIKLALNINIWSNRCMSVVSMYMNCKAYSEL